MSGATRPRTPASRRPPSLPPEPVALHPLPRPTALPAAMAPLTVSKMGDNYDCLH